MGPVYNHEIGRSGLVKLASGIQLTCDSGSPNASILVSAAERVQLNQHARAILDLCDGSRSRDRVVVDALLRSSGSLRASDVLEFLAAARSRGWITEGD